MRLVWKRGFSHKKSVMVETLLVNSRGAISPLGPKKDVFSSTTNCMTTNYEPVDENKGQTKNLIVNHGAKRKHHVHDLAVGNVAIKPTA